MKIIEYPYSVSLTADFTSDAARAEGRSVGVQINITSLAGTITGEKVNIEGSIDGVNYYALKSTTLVAADAGKNPVYYLENVPYGMFIRVFWDWAAATGTITKVLFSV